MIGLENHYDPEVWLLVPTSFPDETGLSVDGWVAGEARKARARGVQTSRKAGPVENYFRALAQFAEEQGRKHDEVWTLVARDAPAVVFMFLDVVEADRSLNDRLTDWAAPAASQYEPATVTQLTSRGLGEGYLVVRHHIDSVDRSIFATLNVVFRVRDYDVVVSMQSHDTTAFDSAIPRIREFVDGITVIDRASP